MGPKINVECPFCKEMFVQNLFGLFPGLFRHCPSCGAAIRFTSRDIRHLYRAIWRRKP